MKRFLLTYLLLTFHLSLAANIIIPDKFYIDQSMTYTDQAISYIRNDDEVIGLISLHIRGDILSGRIPQYDLYTSADGLVAIAKVGVTDQSNRVVFNVLDKEGSFLGTIEENWGGNFFYPTLEIYSVNHELITKGDFDFLGHHLTFSDPNDNHVLAILSSGFTWTWTAKVKDSQWIKQLDDRLFLLSAVVPMFCSMHGRKLSQKS